MYELYEEIIAVRAAT